MAKKQQIPFVDKMRKENFPASAVMSEHKRVQEIKMLGVTGFIAACSKRHNIARPSAVCFSCSRRLEWFKRQRTANNVRTVLPHTSSAWVSFTTPNDRRKDLIVYNDLITELYSAICLTVRMTQRRWLYVAEAFKFLYCWTGRLWNTMYHSRQSLLAKILYKTITFTASWSAKCSSDIKKHHKHCRFRRAPHILSIAI